MFSITLVYEGKNKRIRLGRRVSIRNALEMAGINPETVIIRRNREIIPDNEKIRPNDKIEALKIVSGG